MKSVRQQSRLSAVFLFLVLPAVAHHSTAAFDLGREVTLEAVVKKLDWTNPHVYIRVETSNEAGERVAWAVEAQPPAGMAREGWSAKALAPGDHVIIVANPSKSPGRRIVLGQSVLKDDGTKLYIPQLNNDRAERAASASKSFRADSLSGRWVTRWNPEVALGFLKARTSWSLTPRAIAAMESYDASQNPGNDCIPEPIPYRTIWPLPINIEIGAKTTVITFSTGEQRIVHMGAVSHDGAPYTYLGHSIGSWDGDTLVIDTAHFAEHRRGNSTGGLASSRKKHLVERLRLGDGKTYLNYAFRLEDPEYLAEPVTGTLQLAYRPDFKFTPLACDLKSARRYLEQ